MTCFRTMPWTRCNSGQVCASGRPRYGTSNLRIWRRLWCAAETAAQPLLHERPFPHWSGCDVSLGVRPALRKTKRPGPPDALRTGHPNREKNCFSLLFQSQLLQRSVRAALPVEGPVAIISQVGDTYLAGIEAAGCQVAETSEEGDGVGILRPFFLRIGNQVHDLRALFRSAVHEV